MFLFPKCILKGALKPPVLQAHLFFTSMHAVILDTFGKLKRPFLSILSSKLFPAAYWPEEEIEPATDVSWHVKAKPYNETESQESGLHASVYETCLHVLESTWGQ